MLPKLGLVSIGVHDDVLNWVGKYRPVSIIVVNERGQSRPERPWENNEIDAIRKAMDASPKTLWIFRSWPDGIGENIPGWALWDRLIKCFEPFRGMPNPLMAHGYNEPGDPWVFTERGAEALASIEIKFAERIHAAGLLYGGLCFPESHLGKDHQHLWKYLVPVLGHLDAWIPNEYDWPSVFTSRDQGYKWRVGHWEHQLDRIWQYTKKILPVIIGEGILDGKIKYPYPHGWQKQGGNLNWYPQEHQMAFNDTYYKSEVFAHHTFCYCHPSSEWRSYSVAPILAELGQLVQNQIYWSNGGNNMKNLIKVGIRENYKIWNSPIVRVETMEMEEYLCHCILYEVYASWKPEALKAQAMAARTFATWMKTHGQHVFQGKHIDVCNSICCQMMGPSTDPRTDKAVKDTEGILITHQGEPIKAEYFSFCGGRTEDGGVPYQKSVPCQCWQIAPQDTVKAKHNRGMCQWGAEEMARRGKTYQEILNHYYSLKEPAPDWEAKYKKLKDTVIEEITFLDKMMLESMSRLEDAVEE